ncbi:Cytohesin-1 [Periplaneta americana]|uniref:Cytohesin-1 n=1 Tax=Periplaneta americana TaxID=6978 RepID=A0ABQ8TI32_PERAM|nr:Cytohesin-1 [Periplaneta americana]
MVPQSMHSIMKKLYGCPGMLPNSVILLHDNARPHTANSVRNIVQRFGWETLQLSPYSPDLSPCDFHIFVELKKDIHGLHFALDEDVCDWVKNWLDRQPKSFLKNRIDRLDSQQFLWSFRLPGEAQKIDRMMECFAQRYCQLNPNIFTNTDTCYVLSFAIIMLNTSLHNPSVKDKPTVEQFISMNRGINNGGDLPQELLVSLYESIKTEPFKIPEDDGNDLMHTFFNPDKEGWLWKQGGRYKSWKRRWFILNDNCLYYFEYTTDKEPRGIIPLENIQVREVSDRHKHHCFELYASGSDFIKACKTDSEGKVVEGKHTVYRMSAATPEEKDEWIKCVRQSISHNPFYDMLAARKKKAQKTSAHHHHHSKS